MRAVVVTSGANPEPSAFPQRLRAAAVLTSLFLAFAASAPAGAQSPGGWRFEDDAFADLWFHGLAVVGFHGFGATPLYDPAYARQARDERAASGLGATALERQRATFLRAFQSDPAYEVFHFVPLYFAGAGRTASLDALKELAAGSDRGPRSTGTPTHLGSQVVASLLPEPHQREILGLFVAALEEEWSQVVEPRRAREAGSGMAAGRVTERWGQEWAPALAAFLQTERLSGGLVHTVPALGAEGRFLERGVTGQVPVVAVGMSQGPNGPENAADEALASLVRELCYPAVRRAFAPFEGRLDDRMAASRASDLAATRCGELLVERYVPAKSAAYRTRFHLPEGGMGPGFLSASGVVPGAAAWEGQLEKALLHELNFDADEVRAAAQPVGRK